MAVAHFSERDDFDGGSRLGAQMFIVGVHSLENLGKGLFWEFEELGNENLVEFVWWNLKYEDHKFVDGNIHDTLKHLLKKINVRVGCWDYYELSVI